MHLNSLGTGSIRPLLLLCGVVHMHAAYEVEAVGRDGTTRPFQKPWFLVLLMFTGEPQLHMLQPNITSSCAYAYTDLRSAAGT